MPNFDYPQNFSTIFQTKVKAFCSVFLCFNVLHQIVFININIHFVFLYPYFQQISTTDRKDIIELLNILYLRE